MTTDDPLLGALESAVGRDPTDAVLRLHLVKVLQDAHEHARALGHLDALLETDTATPDTLDLAIASADAIGDIARGDEYRRRRAALDDGASTSDRFRDLMSHGFGVPVGTGPVTPEITPDTWEIERPVITLADVGGLSQVKERLNASFLLPLKNPEIARSFGKSLRGGLLLYGPPGCGKTFIARALAGELGARFLSVSISDVLDMWLGSSERNLHELFETARRNAPAVIFFDELDALGQKRANLRSNPAMRGAVNQLLAELDGAVTDNQGVFVLGASNHPWDIDTALRRPGRFDRTVLVLPPDELARAEILRLHLSGRPVGSVDLGLLSRVTDGFSGADLAYLVERGTEIAMEESLARGSVRPIDTADLRKARAEITPSVKSWFETAKSYAIYANEGGVYDDLLAYLRANKL
jgi:AAA+ superfamily predicted ATPase